jgi:hypothetical protein
MATEPNTGLTLSPAGPLQADLIVNPIIKRLGAVGGNTVGIVDKDLSTPPTLNSTTDVGKSYIVASSPTGAWSGHAGQVAYWNGLSWDFYAPSAGWDVWVQDENTGYRYISGAWVLGGSFTGGALTTALDEAKGANIASAATTNIAAATGNFVWITGTTTITGLGTAQAGARRIVRFAGSLTLTHNATSLILPTGANIVTAANDCATFVSEGSGNWRCTQYQRADGTALVGGGAITSVNTKTGAVIVYAPIIVACSDETTAITAGSNKVKFRMPYAFTLTGVRASLSTAQATNGGGGIFTVDINENGATILSTKITIDNTETTSTTAVTPPVISDASLADDAEISIDVDQIGDGTAKGLKVMLIGYSTS